MTDTSQPKPLSDILTDAVILHALCQGASITYEEVQRNCTSASNATEAMLDELIVKSSQLADDIGRAEDHIKKLTCDLCDAQLNLLGNKHPETKDAQETAE